MTTHLDNLVRAAIKVVTTHREMKRAHKDGASEEARKRYRSTMIAALDRLDVSLEAFAKSEPKPGQKPTEPFDWNGALRAGLAVFRLTQKIGKANSRSEVADIIDADVVSSRTAKP